MRAGLIFAGVEGVDRERRVGADHRVRQGDLDALQRGAGGGVPAQQLKCQLAAGRPVVHGYGGATNRKSTRLNSSHSQISYAVFCLKKKKKICRAYST